MSLVDIMIRAIAWCPTKDGVTREDLASVLGVSKPTVAALIELARKNGHKIKTKRVRQGQRGPLALAYTLESA